MAVVGGRVGRINFKGPIVLREPSIASPSFPPGAFIAMFARVTRAGDMRLKSSWLDGLGEKASREVCVQGAWVTKGLSGNL